jgi:hypothetical protein
VPGGTPPVPPPCFDRSRVKLPLPGGEELARTVLRKYAPNLPVVRSYLGSILNSLCVCVCVKELDPFSNRK